MGDNPWGQVAGAWAAHATAIDEQGAATTRRMLELAQPVAGDRVLELAAGPGGVGLAAAELVGPGGEVVLTDVAEEMVAVAEQRAAYAGATNVSARVLDLEDLSEPDGAFDVVLCRNGLMFLAAPEETLAQVARILRPGGRVAFAVWSARDRNPWLGALLDALGAQLGFEIPPPGLPGPFSLAAPGRLEELLTGAGLTAVTAGEVEADLALAGVDEWWATVPQLAGPLALVIANLPEETRTATEAAARAAVTAYASDGGLVVPGCALVAGGARA